MEKISIQTVPVTIRVMEVGGKRMTLAVFNQIQSGDFFSEEISDEEREKFFIGWVSHKGEKYIVFHENGNLKKDKHVRLTIEYAFQHDLKMARERFEYMMKLPENAHGRSEPYFSLTKENYERARSEYKREADFCREWNSKYENFFTDETQIFIAI